MARARDMDIGMEPVMDMLAGEDLLGDMLSDASEELGDVVPSTPSGQPEAAEEPDPAESEDEVAALSGSELEPPYWINITKRGRHRCLHKFGGCWRKPGACRQDYELFMEVQDTDYHSYCKTCWPQDRPAAARADDEDVNSTQSSSTEDSGSEAY
eukprot:6176760-Karenia_brevis.AAC.1